MHKNEEERSAIGSEIEKLTRALAAPFEAHEVRFRPGVVAGNRALALVYVDARAIQDRLDAVLGVTGWQDEYECLPDGSVVCKLHLRLGSEWITKMDVGGQSEQPDEGDRRKAAFSDALKRAAVKFGIGRYLYRVSDLWVDYDPQRKRFVRQPALPVQALPRPGKERAKEARQGPPSASKPVEPQPAGGSSAPPAGPEPAPASGPARTGPRLPGTGEELQRRLYDYDTRLAKQGVCVQGELVKHVVNEGKKRGYPMDLATWTGPAILQAVEWTKTFEGQKRQALPQPRVA
jgi:hypothetical protein